MIKGISHITFIVHDTEKVASFFKAIFDAEVIYDCDFEEYEKRVQCLGVEIRQPRSRIAGEERLFGYKDYKI